MSKQLAVAPLVEPITRAEAKLHLREDGDEQDSLIDFIIMVARQYVQNWTNRALISQTWHLYLHEFSTVIEIPMPPVQSVVSVVYIDPDGEEQTLDPTEYLTDLVSTPGKVIVLNPPAIKSVPNAVKITFTAGYGDAPADVPEPIRQAMKLLVGHWYENREGVLVGTISGTIDLAIKSLLSPYRYRRLR